jgi:predicted esterase
MQTNPQHHRPRRRRVWRHIALAAVVVLLSAIVIQQLAVRGIFAGRLEGNGPGEAIRVNVASGTVAGRTFLSGRPAPGSPLVVVLHGDAPFRNPGYHFEFAANVAGRVPGVPVVALLRPGYADPYGHRSSGWRGGAAGDDYTLDVAATLAAVIGELRTMHGARTVMLVGHSGGAAITAITASTAPGLIGDAVLLSCPCDVPAFRRHMTRAHLSPFWLWPSGSESPLDLVSRLQRPTRVLAVVGSDDPITLPAYTTAYADAAKRQGIDVTAILLRDRAHEILLEPEVIDLVVARLTGQQP